MDVVLNAQFSFRPGIRCDPGLEVFHLEPVFDIDGKKKSGFGHYKFIVFVGFIALLSS